MPQQKPTSIKELSKRDMLLRSELAHYGHTLGLAITYKNPTTGHVLSSEGSYNSLSMEILSELLNKYVVGTDDEYMEKVADIIKKQSSMENVDVLLTSSINNFDIPGLFKASYRRFVKSTNDNKKQRIHGICVIPIESERHGFYMAYNDKNIAISNRGSSDSLHKFGVRAFELKPGALNTIDKMHMDEVRKGSIAEIEQRFANLAKTEPVLSFEFKSQKTGNCTFANIKSLIKPLLYMLGDTEHYQERYKDFTTWVREYEIKQVIQKYKVAKDVPDVELAEVYEKILITYINRHCLNQTIFGKISESGGNFLFKSVAKSMGRSDVNFKSSDVSKTRRHNNIAMIYKELQNDPKFKKAFEPIVENLKSLDYKESVTGVYPASLPKESSLPVLMPAEDEILVLVAKFVILIPVLMVANIAGFFAAIFNAFIEAAKESEEKNNPKLVANPNSNFVIDKGGNEETAKKARHYERKRRLHIFSTKDNNNTDKQSSNAKRHTNDTKMGGP